MPFAADSTANGTVKVILPITGEMAVYDVQPQHMNLQHFGGSLAEAARNYGRQMAHARDGKWYRRGSWEEITDLRTLALLEKVELVKG